MKQKGLYLLAILVGLIAGFGFRSYRDQPRPNAGHRILYYQDPMHPSYRSDKPGIAPDCGMALVPVYAEEAGQSLASASESAMGIAAIDAATQQLYGIKLAKAERDRGKGSIRVFARVEADQTRIYRLNLGTEGYVKETHDDAVGNHVNRNQRLATVYSPDFLAVASGYLAANERTPGASNAARDNPGNSNTQGTASVQARADRLRNLGMSDAQIDEMSQTRKLPEDVYIVSPTDGFIVSRNIAPGLRTGRDAELYAIADLSSVWVVAEVFGNDAQAFHSGTPAVATYSETGEKFPVRVSNVLPEIDPATRTLKIRLEAANPGFKLRPGMFVSVDVPASSRPGSVCQRVQLSIPELRSGSMSNRRKAASLRERLRRAGNWMVGFRLLADCGRARMSSPRERSSWTPRVGLNR